MMQRQQEQHSNSSKSNKKDACRKTFLLVMTFLMTWMSTYRMVSKMRFDVTGTIQEESSLNGSNTPQTQKHKEVPSQYSITTTTKTKIRTNEKPSFPTFDIVQRADDRLIDILDLVEEEFDDDQ